MFCVYFLQSTRNNKIYTGVTEKEAKIRCAEHNRGSDQWTRENGPFLLLYFENYLCKEDAYARERFYKTGFGRFIRNAILSAVSAKGGPASGGGSAHAWGA